MVQPSDPNVLRTFQNVQVTASLQRLEELLPFRQPSFEELQTALVNMAHKLYNPSRATELVGIAQDVQDVATQLIRYVTHLAESDDREYIDSPQALLDNFVAFLLEPITTAERNVEALDREARETIAQHGAQLLTNTLFSRDPEEAVATLTGYRRLLERLFDKVSALRRQVKVLDVIFVDPYNSIIKMRAALHELSNILEQQESSARGIIEFKDIETTRAKYFKGLHSIFGEHLDPFDRIKAAYPQIWIKIPKKRIHIPNAETIQSILHHLVQNSIKSGAQEIIIQVLRRNSRIVTIAVIDDGPGIPRDIQGKLGKELIGDSSGWYILKNELVPLLGDQDETGISFTSPWRNKRGTLVKLTLPLTPRKDGPDGTTGGPGVHRNGPTRRTGSGPLPAAEDINRGTRGILDTPLHSSRRTWPTATDPAVAGALGMTGQRMGVLLTFPLMPSHPR